MTPTLDLPRFEPLLDTQRAAALLGIHPKTLQKLARAGNVPCHRIGDLWRFRASDLDMCASGDDKLEIATRAVTGENLVYAHTISERKSSSEKERERFKVMGV